MAYYPRLRDMREDHDLTQQKLAEYLGMPQPQYFRYEQGLRDIPTDILIQLAKLYNTTTDYLLGLTDDPVPTLLSASVVSDLSVTLLLFMLSMVFLWVPPSAISLQTILKPSKS